jgi:hypothetical protein
MRLNYYRDTDSLYIELSSKPGTTSEEISEGIVLDYDADGNIAHRRNMVPILDYDYTLDDAGRDLYSMHDPWG